MFKYLTLSTWYAKLCDHKEQWTMLTFSCCVTCTWTGHNTNLDLECVPILLISILTTRTRWGCSQCSNLPVIGYSWACKGQILQNSMTAANRQLHEFRASTHRLKSVRSVSSKIANRRPCHPRYLSKTLALNSFNSKLIHNDNPKDKHKWMYNSNLRKRGWNSSHLSASL